MCILLEQVTHTRYEEKKETGVGDGDRELSRLPGPTGSTGNKSDPPPRTVFGFEMLFEIQEIKEHKHMHTQPYTQKSKDTEKCMASVVPI